MRRAKGKKEDGKLLRGEAFQAALLAVERLRDLLSNPEASNADVLKAATLIFERIYQAQESGPAGDFDICVKEE